MQRSPIQWTDFTANPLKYRDPDGNVVHACIHKSGGCLHCYAETLAGRWGRAGKKFTAENMKRLTPFMDEKELHHMLTNKPAAGQRCFVGDMTDIFGEWVPFELLDKLFAVFALRSDMTFQILTKRPERMRTYMTDKATPYRINISRGDPWNVDPAVNWPLPNCWMGVSVEDQKTADERIPILLDTPGAVRFISYEPALQAVAFSRFLSTPLPRMIDWTIVGGESGPGARLFNIQWARDVVAQCRAAGVACFVKQLGANPFLEVARTHHSETPKLKIHFEEYQFEATVRLKDRSGGDMQEWPEDLRVREFPREVPA